MSNQVANSIKVQSLIFEAAQAFKVGDAEKMCKAMGWFYHDSKGETASAEEISNCLSSCVYSAIRCYQANVVAGKPYLNISCGTGRVWVRVDFFTPDAPQAYVYFGEHVSRS
jgi:hypothetical protein